MAISSYRVRTLQVADDMNIVAAEMNHVRYGIHATIRAEILSQVYRALLQLYQTTHLATMLDHAALRQGKTIIVANP